MLFNYHLLFYMYGYIMNGDDAGPSTWGEMYSACDGQSQSPIDLSFNGAPDTIQAFSFTGYDDTSVDMTIKNNGHSGR